MAEDGGARAEDDGTPVEHDPLAEEADLLTIQEAKARIVEELRLVRRRLAEVGEGGADSEALRLRRDHLERAAARFAGR